VEVVEVVEIKAALLLLEAAVLVVSGQELG
jgi:hypothetical protein